ncbi:MAG: tol-pal system YbgF family protein [Marinifilaceae bacterium]
MSKEKKDQLTEDNFENLEEALSRTEQYIEKNQKKLSIIALAIIVVVGGFLSYNKFYLKPLEDSAQNQMFQAQRYFEQDSFRLALDGDENYPGFLEIIEDYSATNAASLAHYYSGISYLRLGKYNEAIDYLKKYDADDFLIAPLAQAAIGDAYFELGDAKEAASFYLKASDLNTNNFTTPIYLQKAGIAFEQAKEYQKALNAYEKIEKEFKQSAEARDIEKYITRAKAMIK